MRTERWLPVVGYEGFYEVSDMGAVRSVDRIDSIGRRRNGSLLTLTYRIGYHRVSLYRDSKATHPGVHTLVLTAFVGPRPDGCEVRHLNGVRDDNRLENLAWGTSSENNLDRVRHGTHNNAAKTHCPQGHPYDEANTMYRKKSSGGMSRECKACNRARVARHNRQRKEERA